MEATYSFPINIYYWFSSPSGGSLANIATLAGLGFTIWTLTNVRQIRSQLGAVSRLIEIRSQITTRLSTVIDLISNYAGNERKIGVEFSHVSSLVSSLQPHIPEATWNKLSQYSTVLTAYLNGDKSEDKAWGVYESISGLITKVDQIIQDMRMEK